MLSENMAIEVLDVLRYRPKNGKLNTPPRSFCALSFRLHGDSKFTLADRTETAKSGNIVFTPDGLGYQHTVQDLDLIVFHFRLYNCVTNSLQVLSPKNPAIYRMQFDKALALWKSKTVGYKYETAALLYQILASMQKDGLLMTSQDDAPIQASIQYIKDHFTEHSLSVAALAKHALMSEAYYRRRFHAATGTAPKQYIASLRIEYAISLLSTGYYSQTEIAARCGYADVKYFREAFRRHTGTPISKYKYTF